MDEASCTKCGEAAQYKCERCLEPYCSSQCQIIDWQDHKSKCYKFPNLIPINILKPVSSNQHLDKVGCSPRRHQGSLVNGNENRRPSTPLNSCKTKQKALLKDDDFNMVVKTAPMSAPQIAKPLSVRPTTWRTVSPPSEGFFEALIQFKEDECAKRIVWITDLKCDSSLRKLLAEINRTVKQKSPCSVDEIYEGALVAAPLDNMLYRAEVLEIFSDVQKATVRLIDYGNELRIPCSQLYPPIPIMYKLNPYAFRVCIPNDYGPLEIESIVTVRILGEKRQENYYDVECKVKTISLNLPIELLSSQPVLKFVKCFRNGRNALLRLCNGGSIDDNELNTLLNSEQSLSYEFDTLQKVGAFVAARTPYGWRRARLLGFYEKQNLFLVYAIDDGIIILSPQIKKVPEKFISQPICVFAISTNSSDCMLSEPMLSTAKSLSLQLLPSSSGSMNKDSKTNLTCALFDEKRKIVDQVIATVFTGSICELGLKLWNENIPEGDTVVISNVFTYKEIHIASQQNIEYPNILMSEYLKCVPYATDEKIDCNDVVMYSVNTSYCRGQVITYEKDNFMMTDIDSGKQSIVGRNVLRKPTLLVSSLPVRCYRVTLMFLESIPTPVANNKALEALETCMNNSVEFYVTFGENRTVDLLFRTTEKQSLCKKLLPMVFEPATRTTQNQPASPLAFKNKGLLSPNHSIASESTTAPLAEANLPATITKGNKLFMMSDLEIIPITCGEKVPLYVLDTSTILNSEGPYITAADYNKECLAKMEQYLQGVSEYCNSEKAPKGGYAPKKMEICLSIFSDDGEWYRAVCIDRKSNDYFVVMFLDYGNISKVNRKHIMPMISNLMFPSNANMVYIEDIQSKEQGLAFQKSVLKNPIIYANVSRVNENEDAYKAKLLV